MPWKIHEGDEDCPFEVVTEDDGERVACHPTREKAEAHMRALYANEPEAREEKPKAPVEFRAANLDDVNFPERTITVIAVPYEEPAQIEYRGQVWNEVFSRSAFNGVETRQRRIPVVADLQAPKSQSHEGAYLVGKVAEIFPGRSEGLVLRTRISKTPHGDAALELAADDALSPSVGVAMRSGDQILDRRTMTRRINRAFLDHLALVAQPAYLGAQVLEVRQAPNSVAPHLLTPNLDELVMDPVFAWANERLK